MGIETAQSGAIPLKDGVTLEAVVKLWDEEELVDPDQTIWSDDYTVFDLDGRELRYEFNGDSFWYAEKVQDWLKEAQTELANDAWYDTDRSFEGMGEETLYGPTERAKLKLKIFGARIQIQDLQRQLEEDEAQLETLDE